MCGIQDVIAKGKVDETVDMLCVTTTSALSEMEIKKTMGNNELPAVINNVKRIRQKSKRP